MYCKRYSTWITRVKGIGIVGMFCVADHVRPEAMEVVSTLDNDDYNVMMLSGDGTYKTY